MEIKGLDLDNSPILSENQSLRYAENIELRVNQNGYFNERGFDVIGKISVINKITGVTAESIRTIGVITTNIGFVVFAVSTLTVNGVQGDYDLILYLRNENGQLIYEKIIYATHDLLNFDPNHPITGTYTYNYKNELIVEFEEGVDSEANETRIINVTNPLYNDSTNLVVQLTEKDINSLDVIPNIVYPILSFAVSRGGNLKTGSYQVAIKYKLKDNTYTNYSILHTPISIVGDTQAMDTGVSIEIQNAAPGTMVNKKIVVSFNQSNPNYDTFKLAIVYITDEGQEIYETEDLEQVSGYNVVTISNLTNFSKITLDDILINNISYIKNSTSVNFNDRLIRGNVSTVNYEGFDNILKNAANNANVSVVGSLTPVDKYFKTREVYSLYIGFIDYKGSFVNAYKIPWKSTDQTLNFNTDHQIPYTTGNGSSVESYGLRVSLPSDIQATIPKEITGFAIFFVEHDFSNSLILAQAVVTRDSVQNSFSASQQYSGAFSSGSKMRFYPFEYLFNITQGFNARIRQIKPNNTSYWSVDTNIPDNLKVQYGNTLEELNGRAYYNGTSIPYNFSQTLLGPISLDHIANDNVVDANIAGDSFYRLNDSGVATQLFGSASDGDVGGNVGFALVELVNPSDILYNDEYNQKLQISSSIYPIDGIAVCYGDTYCGHLRMRMTAPTSEYRLGTEDTELESNHAVVIWLFDFIVESKFNISGRFTISSALPLMYDINQNSRIEQYSPSYKLDNFINTDTGKGYSLSYNENGIQDYKYYKKIEGISDHISRIVRSHVFGSESNVVNWRYYDTNEYKDMPLDRGAIIALKTDNRYLYIQQRYGLRLLSIKDMVSTREEDKTYLGSSDLFDRLPEEILYTQSGYIGCISQYDTTINLFGYFVIDNDRGRIFHIFGNEVSEISAINCKEWFKNNIEKFEKNNPFYGTGRYFNFNEETQTLYLTQNGTTNPFTMSFGCIVNKWISFHTYTIRYGFHNRNNTIYIDSGQNVYYVSKANYGKYQLFGNTQIIRDSIIKIVLNEDVTENKLLNSIIWKDSVSDVSNPNLPKTYWDKTIYLLAVHNDDQATGHMRVNNKHRWWDAKTGETKANIWKFNKIDDIALSNDLLIDPVTFKNDVLELDRKWFKRSKFICQYVYAITTFSNSEQLLHEVEDISAEWILDNRTNY